MIVPEAITETAVIVWRILLLLMFMTNAGEINSKDKTQVIVSIMDDLRLVSQSRCCDGDRTDKNRSKDITTT